MGHRVIAVIGCLTVFALSMLHAQAPTSQTQGVAMAAEIQESINRLAPFTQTSCRAGGGSTPGATSFLAISVTPIWDNADARLAWLEAVIESAGNALSKNATAKVDELIVADVQLLSERVAWGLPVELLKQAYDSWKDGKIRKDEMAPMVEKGLVRKPINAR